MIDPFNDALESDRVEKEIHERKEEERIQVEVRRKEDRMKGCMDVKDWMAAAIALNEWKVLVGSDQSKQVQMNENLAKLEGVGHDFLKVVCTPLYQLKRMKLKKQLLCFRLWDL